MTKREWTQEELESVVQGTNRGPYGLIDPLAAKVLDARAELAESQAIAKAEHENFMRSNEALVRTVAETVSLKSEIEELKRQQKISGENYVELHSKFLEAHIKQLEAERLLKENSWWQEFQDAAADRDALRAEVQKLKQDRIEHFDAHMKEIEEVARKRDEYARSCATVAERNVQLKDGLKASQIECQKAAEARQGRDLMAKALRTVGEERDEAVKAYEKLKKEFETASNSAHNREVNYVNRLKTVQTNLADARILELDTSKAYDVAIKERDEAQALVEDYRHTSIRVAKERNDALDKLEAVRQNCQEMFDEPNPENTDYAKGIESQCQEVLGILKGNSASVCKQGTMYVILDLKRNAYNSVEAVVEASNREMATRQFSESIRSWEEGFVCVGVGHFSRCAER